MTKRTFDRQSLEEKFQGAHSLGDVFRQAEAQIQELGEIVCRFSVNGLSLTEEDETKFSNFMLGEVDLLEIESESPDKLLSEVIENWVTSLPALIKKSDQLSQTLRQEGIENHVGQFVEIVDSCQFLVESLISLRTLCQSYPFVDSGKWKENETLSAKAIQQALVCFETKDFVLLADVLEYDLAHGLQSWLEALSELREHVRQTPYFVG